MKQKICPRALLALLMVLALVFTGCGGVTDTVQDAAPEVLEEARTPQQTQAEGTIALPGTEDSGKTPDEAGQYSSRDEVHLVGGQTVQSLSHGLVGQGHGLLNGFALDHFRGHGGRGDGRAAAEGLKFYVLNDVIGDFQIDLHNVAALGVADLSHATGVLNNAHIPGMHEVIHNLFAVKCH